MVKESWFVFQCWLSALAGFIGAFLGGLDGLIWALLAFVIIDYITGLLCAISEKKLSSAVGFRGIAKKVLIFLLVGVGNILDQNIIGSGSALRTAIAVFYISNEGVSLMENASRLGLPVPDKLKLVLSQLHGKESTTSTSSKNQDDNQEESNNE